MKKILKRWFRRKNPKGNQVDGVEEAPAPIETPEKEEEQKGDNNQTPNNSTPPSQPNNQEVEKKLLIGLFGDLSDSDRNLLKDKDIESLKQMLKERLKGSYEQKRQGVIKDLFGELKDSSGNLLREKEIDDLKDWISVKAEADTKRQSPNHSPEEVLSYDRITDYIKKSTNHLKDIYNGFHKEIKNFNFFKDFINKIDNEINTLKEKEAKTLREIIERRQDGKHSVANYIKEEAKKKKQENGIPENLSFDSIIEIIINHYKKSGKEEEHSNEYQSQENGLSQGLEEHNNPEIKQGSNREDEQHTEEQSNKAISSPQDENEDVKQVKEEILNHLKDALGHDIELPSITKDNIKKAILEYRNKALKERLIQLIKTESDEDPSIEELVKKIKEAINNGKLFMDFCEGRYEKKEIKEALEKYTKKEWENTKNSILKGCEELECKEDIEKAENAHKLANAIIKVAKKNKKDLKEKKESEKKLTNKIQNDWNIDPSLEFDPDEELSSVIEKYTGASKKLIDSLTNEKKKLEDEKKNLNEEIEDKKQAISEKDEIIQNEIKQINGLWISDIGDIEKCYNSSVPLFNPCDESNQEQSNQCDDIESKLREKIKVMIDELRDCQPSNETSPSDCIKGYKERLLSVLSKDDGAVNVVCRYYAYSILPFMTDTTRDFGLLFNRRPIATLYEAVKKLVSHFGYTIILPNLYAETLKDGVDGDYEDFTGKAYSDLDIFCPNARNHKKSIDNPNTEQVIVDIVSIGYKIDGQTFKAKVII